WSRLLDFLRAKTMGYFLFDKSLLPLGREAAPKMGLLRSPTGASSLATGYFLPFYLLTDRH
ncbi:hypothetical protein, partial [Pseudomonas fluorescens]|uniref:hypothetical protein n=1 Tax=Pseudomonas fluorescens TaxID=294 RepID=UPI001A7EDAE0